MSAHRFHSVRGLQYLLADLLQQLEVARSVVVAQIDKLIVTDPSLLVDSVVQCCLRPPLNTRLVDRSTLVSLTFLIVIMQLCNSNKKLPKFVDAIRCDRDSTVRSTIEVEYAHRDTDVTVQ